MSWNAKKRSSHSLKSLELPYPKRGIIITRLDSIDNTPFCFVVRYGKINRAFSLVDHSYTDAIHYAFDTEKSIQQGILVPYDDYIMEDEEIFSLEDMARIASNYDGDLDDIYYTDDETDIQGQGNAANGTQETTVNTATSEADELNKLLVFFLGN